MKQKNIKSQFTAEELKAARKARNEYLREWRKRNPEKVKEYEIKHFLKVAQEGKANNECEPA